MTSSAPGNELTPSDVAKSAANEMAEVLRKAQQKKLDDKDLALLAHLRSPKASQGWPIGFGWDEIRNLIAKDITPNDMKLLLDRAANAMESASKGDGVYVKDWYDVSKTLIQLGSCIDETILLLRDSKVVKLSDAMVEDDDETMAIEMYLAAIDARAKSLMKLIKYSNIAAHNVKRAKYED